jgi:hypothetical protein
MSLSRSVRATSLAIARSFALAALPVALAADDPEFFLPPSDGGSLRVLTLGGAFVGLADDAGTVTANPAGLVAVPRSFEVVAAPHGTGSSGRPRHAAVALHPSPWVAAGAGWQQNTPRFLLGTDGSSRLEGRDTMTFLGAGFSFPDRRFSGGLSGEWRRLSYGTGSEQGRDEDFSWTAGLLFRPEHREVPRLGLRYVGLSEWTLADGRRVRRPPVVSTGISWHYRALHISDILVSFQSDWVRYSALTKEAPEDRRARNDLDVRLGLELSFPFQCFTGCGSLIQVRAGIHNAAPRPFDLGSKPSPEAVGQGPARGNTWAVGAALALRSILQGRLKAEVSYERSARALGFGLGFRFPEAYRAEIEDQTRR